MKQLVCEMCGSSDILKQDGVFVCQSCGMKYSAEEAKKMMIEGTVEIQGTVKVDNMHMIENYFELATTALNAGNNAEAESYCNKIIEIDPVNYKALMIKGESVAWQSTLAHSRVDEGLSSFIKAILNAPDDECEELVEYAKDQIIRLSTAMISLRGERFAKWPDDEECSCFLKEIASIIETVFNFMSETGGIISPADLMCPISKEINSSIINAYKNVILPDYQSEKYPYPDRDDWREYVGRVDRCILLLERAVGVSGENNEDDIQRYKNLIFLQNAVIDSCSYDYKYFDFRKDLGPNWVKKGEAAARADGYFPDSRNDRLYFKDLVLTSEAKGSRRALVQEYESKINDITNAKEKAEREEKDRRFTEYWSEHTKEKESLEEEEKKLKKEINELEQMREAQMVELNKKIDSIPGKLELQTIEENIKNLSLRKDSLGIFKGKEKATLQEQIDELSGEKDLIAQKMKETEIEISREKVSVRNEYAEKISPLVKRIKEIEAELTMER